MARNFTHDDEWDIWVTRYDITEFTYAELISVDYLEDDKYIVEPVITVKQFTIKDEYFKDDNYIVLEKINDKWMICWQKNLCHPHLYNKRIKVWEGVNCTTEECFDKLSDDYSWDDHRDALNFWFGLSNDEKYKEQ